MSSTAAELAGATDADIASARSAFVSFLQARWPALAIRGGPLSDMIVGPAADALAAVDVRATQAEVSYDPETALANGGYDSTILDSVLTGRGVTRISAAAASGTVALRFATSTTRTIVQGLQFSTSDGTLYQISSAVRLLAPGSAPTLDTDVVMVVDPAGGFTGAVPIEAIDPGAAGTRPSGTAVTAVVTDTTLLAAWFASDVTGGRDAETDAALLARLPSATAPRTAASIVGAEGLVQDVVTAVSAFSAIKFGDTAMMRGRSSLSCQTPGRFDLRYRTATQPSRVRVTVTATYVGLVGSYTSWRFSLTVGEAPGRFLVEKVIPTAAAITAGGYVPTSVTPGYDLSGVTNPPDIRSSADAALSRYAIAGGQFTDPNTPATGLTVNVSTKNYDVICRTIPGIDVGQAAVVTADALPSGGDCLVRSSVPVMVSVTVVATPAAGVTVTASQVATAVARAVNSQGINSRLSAAQVAAKAVTYLPAGTSLLLSGFSGIVYPADTSATLAATVVSDGLTVSDNLARNVSTQTIAYYCDPESVSASVS